mmetsp:Transcript_105463/g.264050  ORF Transcript_105463/g.264050 Transcript_105463/m.264050 type:complete len:338 (+) Transcript_105463:95-1108(+)
MPQSGSIPQRRPVRGSSGFILKSVIAAAWLTAALALGRLTHEYIPVGGSSAPRVKQRLVPRAPSSDASVAKYARSQPLEFAASPASTSSGAAVLIGAAAAAFAILATATSLHQASPVSIPSSAEEIPVDANLVVSLQSGADAALSQAQTAFEEGTKGLETAMTQMTVASGEACQKLQHAAMDAAQSAMNWSIDADILTEKAGKVAARSEAVLHGIQGSAADVAPLAGRSAAAAAGFTLFAAALSASATEAPATAVTPRNSLAAAVVPPNLYQTHMSRSWTPSAPRSSAAVVNMRSTTPVIVPASRRSTPVYISNTDQANLRALLLSSTSHQMHRNLR